MTNQLLRSHVPFMSGPWPFLFVVPVSLLNRSWGMGGMDERGCGLAGGGGMEARRISMWLIAFCVAAYRPLCVAFAFCVAEARRISVWLSRFPVI